MLSGTVLGGCSNGVFYLRLTGDVRLPWCVTLENYCNYVLQNEAVSSVLIDLTESDNLDSTTLGILAKIGQSAGAQLKAKPDVYLLDGSIQRLLQSMGFDALFSIHLAEPPAKPALPVLPLGDSDEAQIQDSVIDAHRALMDMNKQNIKQFESLVETLERARDGEQVPPSTDK